MSIEKEIQALESAINREKARKDPLWFAETYLSHLLTAEIPDFHREWYKLFQTESRLAIAAHRNFAKSHVLVIIHGLWRLLTGENEKILAISQSDTLAKNWVRLIKQEMEANELILRDWGESFTFGPEISQKWTENHISLDRNGRVFNEMLSRGKGTQIRGFRPSRVFCDDLEDDLELRNEENRKHNKEWFLGPVMNTIKTSDQIIILGTLLHPLCLLKEIIDKKPPFQGWNTKKYAAIMDRKSIWPQRWPLEELRKRMDELGMWTFNKEYMNDPQFTDDVIFRQEWLNTYEELPKIIKKVMGIDLAASQKRTADYTAYVVWGEAEDGKIYCLEAAHGRWGTFEQIDRFFQAGKKHSISEALVEEGLLWHSIGQPLIQRARDKGIYFQLTPIKLGAFNERQQKQSPDKVTRAYRVLPLFEQKRVLFRKDQREIFEEFATFPTGQHDDLVDAAVLGLFSLTRGMLSIEHTVTPRYKIKAIPGFDPRKPWESPTVLPSSVGPVISNEITMR